MDARWTRVTIEELELTFSFEKNSSIFLFVNKSMLSSN